MAIACRIAVDSGEEVGGVTTPSFEEVRRQYHAWSPPATSLGGVGRRPPEPVRDRADGPSGAPFSILIQG